MLVIGDFLSTFLYHVPEHVFGKFHALIHHGPNRNFLYYAVLSRNPWVLLDGLLGALPYFLMIPVLGSWSVPGVVLGLLLGWGHVVWRHTSLLAWRTPAPVQLLCDLLWIVTPERHWQHHLNANLAYGDIFTFYDAPARYWLQVLRRVKHSYRLRFPLALARAGVTLVARAPEPLAPASADLDAHP